MADWHRLDGKRMKIVLMVIMRSQRPAQVEVPFFIVSLAAFNRVESHFMCCAFVTVVSMHTTIISEMCVCVCFCAIFADHDHGGLVRYTTR